MVRRNKGLNGIFSLSYIKLLTSNLIVKDIFKYELFEIGQYHLAVYQVILVLAIIFLTKGALFLLKKTLYKSKLFRRIDKGQAFAYYQITKYVLIVVAAALILESLGFKVTFLLAGSAALLVGIGLGLQQLFNDLVCGFIILTEHSIKVEDIIEVDGIVAKVKQIGLRTSQLETRDAIIMILPNSKIVNEKVINWSHNKGVTRFDVKVGVAYGSDVEKVKSVLLACAAENAMVSKNRESIARFVDFGESSLDFVLIFWSTEKFLIEEVKSQLRFAINKRFNEHQISIPFPQRDLHIVSGKLQDHTTVGI